MKKIGFIVLMAVMLLLTIVTAGANDNGKVRVIARTDQEVKDAISQGCTVVQETRTLKALVCPKGASTGLQEDILMHAVDSTANAQIGADAVQLSGINGTGRKVVVLDTGYNYNHPELSSSYLGGKDFANNDSDPMDDNGHGSHVAGIITGDGPASTGVAPGTGIIAGKVLDASGSGYFSNIVAAIYWAVDGPDGTAGTPDDFNADAISMSLGSSSTYKSFCDNAMPDMTGAINYALSRGVLVVAAAGNRGGAGVSIPGCVSYSTTVGAVDSADRLAYFSGTGKAVDITAPGVSIYSTWLGSSYYTASGTSMATPVVSGMVALIKSAHPGYTPSQVQTALFTTVKDLGRTGKDSSYGYGRANASGAVNYLLP